MPSVVLLALPTIVLMALPNVGQFLLWGAVGLGSCGTPYPGWWRGPHDPDPEPWAVLKLIGLVTGILGGWAYTQLFAAGQERWDTALPAAASCVGAYAVARIAGSVYGHFAAGNKTAGGN